MLDLSIFLHLNLSLHFFPQLLFIICLFVFHCFYHLPLYLLFIFVLLNLNLFNLFPFLLYLIVHLFFTVLALFFLLKNTILICLLVKYFSFAIFPLDQRLFLIHLHFNNGFLKQCIVQ